jgi:hypothetical protein
LAQHEAKLARGAEHRHADRHAVRERIIAVEKISDRGFERVDDFLETTDIGRRLEARAERAGEIHDLVAVRRGQGDVLPVRLTHEHAFGVDVERRQVAVGEAA